MTAHVIKFPSLLNISQVDILDFSLGGVIAPLVELNGPKGPARKFDTGWHKPDSREEA